MGIFLTVLPLAVGGAAAVLTMDAMAQYSAQPQPPLAPPAWVFPAVWTVLYLLMGAASRRVYRLGTQESRNALVLAALSAFSRLDKAAGRLLMPYAAWLLFAAYLNYSMIRMA